MRPTIKHVAGRSAYNYYYRKKLISERGVLRRIYYPPLRDVVGWYPCDEGGGTVVHDHSPLLNHLYPAHVLVPEWRFLNGSPCLYFNGSAMSVRTFFPVDPVLGTTRKATIACHMNSEVSQVGNTVSPFSKSNSLCLQFDHPAGVFQGCFAIKDSLGGWHTTGGPTIITPNVEHHFAGTYDGNIMSMYLDKELARSAVVGAFTIDVGFKTYIGYDDAGTTPFRGTVRDCLIAADCYSLSEIRRLADSHV